MLAQAFLWLSFWLKLGRGVFGHEKLFFFFFSFVINGKRKSLALYLISGCEISKPKEIPGRNPRNSLWGRPYQEFFSSSWYP